MTSESVAPKQASLSIADEEEHRYTTGPHSRPCVVVTPEHHNRVVARLEREALRTAIAAGLASCKANPAKAVFDRLETKYRKLHGKRAA